MLEDFRVERVYLACGRTDMCRSIDGLAAIVQAEFQLDPLFVFCNRKRDRIKILQWEHNGFWLHYKRLERGGFQWSDESDVNTVVRITRRELQWLLDGLSLE